MADTNEVIKYTVKQGDTLSEIALEYKSQIAEYKNMDLYQELVPHLAKINNIPNPDLIHPGQELIIYGASNEVQTTKSTPRASITSFGPMSHTPGTLFATWYWSRTDTERYMIRWKYKTADGKEYYGNNSPISYDKQDPDACRFSTYEIPSAAVSVSFSVKPICSSDASPQWTADWSTVKTYSTVPIPPKPEITLYDADMNGKLSIKVTVSDMAMYKNASHLQFQVIKDNKTFATISSMVKITNSSYIEWTYTNVLFGSTYQVRCRGARSENGKYIYSEYSAASNVVVTPPVRPEGFRGCKQVSKDSIQLSWKAVANAVSYDIQYVTDLDDFKVIDKPITISGIKALAYTIPDMETGFTYYFRLRAVNVDGKASLWSESMSSQTLGEAPASPTTWSSSTSVIVGEPVTLYWVHNAKDNSDVTSSQIEIYLNGSVVANETYTIEHEPPSDDDEDNGVKSYSLDTSKYPEGTNIKWRVRTTGIAEELYGTWSVYRYIDVYAQPWLELGVSNTEGGDAISVVEAFPIYITAIPYPITQTPVGYQLTIVANDPYETVDNMGNVKMVNAGETVFSRYYDTSAILSTVLSAGDVDLQNNVSYTITCVLSMDSGLDAENSVDVTVGWTDVSYWPSATISIDEETLVANIGPYCFDADGNVEGDVLLSVYRREFDGRFTEIASGLENGYNVGVTDPHPALDYARYRIVATSKTTGSVSYYDMPGYPVGEKAVVIQWDEEWSTFDLDNEETTVQPSWLGSMLKLPYNIDISDSNNPDVSLVEYIGREHPVSYFGTQVGESSTWKVSIEKDDKETIYALRRLSRWMGNAYVREPSGSGYWAYVTVSFVQNHNELTIPVTLEIRRVEGGA